MCVFAHASIAEFIPGKYYETYYILFESREGRHSVRKHTIPHFVPLSELSTKFLSRDLRVYISLSVCVSYRYLLSAVSVPAHFISVPLLSYSSFPERVYIRLILVPFSSFTPQLLNEFMSLYAVLTHEQQFLDAVSGYLDAYVSRRESFLQLQREEKDSMRRVRCSVPRVLLYVCY